MAIVSPVGDEEARGSVRLSSPRCPGQVLQGVLGTSSEAVPGAGTGADVILAPRIGELFNLGSRFDAAITAR